jgi:hypothetical protein
MSRLFSQKKKNLVLSGTTIYLGTAEGKWKGHWWLSRTSNPVHRVNSLVGGFDSHALPPNTIRKKPNFPRLL